MKSPELPRVSLSTRPSGSVVVTDAPFNVRAVLAVPDCVVPILSTSVVPTNLRNPSKLLPIAFTAIDDDAPIDPEVIE